MAQNMPNSHEAVKFMKPIPPLLIALLLCSCGGHTNKSVPEPVKTSAKVVAVSPVLLVGGSMIGEKKWPKRALLQPRRQLHGTPKKSAESASGNLWNQLS